MGGPGILGSLEGSLGRRASPTTPFHFGVSQMSAVRFERPWKVWEALEFWEAWKDALEGGPGRNV